MGRKFFLLTGVAGLPNRKRWFRSPRQKKAVGYQRKLRRFPEKQLHMVCQHGDKGNPSQELPVSSGGSSVFLRYQGI
ncbi:MAG: hypothetical protein ACLT4D_15445 [Blautia faecis]